MSREPDDPQESATAPQADGPDLDRQNDATQDAARPELVIRVERTGGFAGLRREWSVHVSDEREVERWRPVVDACPWDDDGPEPVHPDRFVYEIRVRESRVSVSHRERSAVLPEQRMTGPWRTLVDRVREADESPKTTRPRSGGRRSGGPRPGEPRSGEPRPGGRGV